MTHGSTLAVDLEIARGIFVAIHDRQRRSFKGLHRVHGKHKAERRVGFRVLGAVLPLHGIAEHQIELAGAAEDPLLAGVLEQRRIAGQARGGLGIGGQHHVIRVKCLGAG